MKPKTNLQREVFKYYKQLRPLNSYVKKWAEKQFEAYILTKYKKRYCSECNNIISTSMLLKDTLFKKKCNNCNVTLNTIVSTKASEDLLFNIVTTYKGYQVIRILLSKKCMWANKTPKYYHTEVAQYWINTKGKITIISKSPSSNYYQEYDFALTSTMEIRETHRISNNMFIIPSYIYPKIEVLDIIRRNGYKDDLHNLIPVMFFNSILSESKLETILKAKQYNLFYYGAGNIYNIDKYWHSIKIAIRNDYIVKDTSLWIDYLKDLEFFGLDLNSPKYVCISDVKDKHAHYTKKRNKIAEKEAYAAQKEEIVNNTIEYIKKKQSYFNIVLRNDNITIEPLKDVKEFLEEGLELKHCVFTSKYYKRSSLILSAKVDGERMETIEFDLKNRKILQSRGFLNENSKYHNEIKELINNNLKQLSNG